MWPLAIKVDTNQLLEVLRDSSLLKRHFSEPAKVALLSVADVCVRHRWGIRDCPKWETSIFHD